MHGIAQIVIVAVIALLYIYIINTLRKENIDFQYALLWIGAGIVMLVFALYPPILDFITDTVGIAMPLNLLFFLGIVFLMTISFKISISFTMLKKKIYTLTQHVAILEKMQQELISQHNDDREMQGDSNE